MFAKLTTALCCALFFTSANAQAQAVTTPDTTTVPSNPVTNGPVGVPANDSVSTPKGIGHSFAVAPTPAFVAQFLDAHNGYRIQFGAPNMTYNSGLFQGTYDWSIQCQFRHSTPNGAYGEDLYAATYSNTNYYSATYSWVVTEYQKYNYANPGFSEATGHFTQVVWVSSTGVACSTARCPANTIFSGYASYFIVCRYTPAGNVQGQFPQNVRTLGSPVSGPTTGTGTTTTPASKNGKGTQFDEGTSGGSGSTTAGDEASGTSGNTSNGTTTGQTTQASSSASSESNSSASVTTGTDNGPSTDSGTGTGAN
ncbi:PR-1-like protein [Pluteus cervinus]|uniref:PR-1-like protein n=1 Tax=Pluteus cervinus TaxID=181527 RepID=A0ACD3AHG1_9AGAR|nr:PR-1-like protein [Pluteus cervinus]